MGRPGLHPGHLDVAVRHDPVGKVDGVVQVRSFLIRFSLGLCGCFPGFSGGFRNVCFSFRLNFSLGGFCRSFRHAFGFSGFRFGLRGSFRPGGFRLRFRGGFSFCRLLFGFGGVWFRPGSRFSVFGTEVSLLVRLQTSVPVAPFRRLGRKSIMHK